MTQAFNLSRFANKVNTTGQADLTTAVTGTLPVANGGTNNGSLAVTAGGVVYTDGSKLVNVGAGTTGQALLSNGASAPTWGSVGSLSWQAVQTTGFTAVSGNGYPCNTTTAAFTVTLPASPSAGNTISIIDYAGTAATNNITISPNGNKLQGNVASGKISTNREAVNLVYVDATQGWLAYSDVYSSGNPLPANYTASYLVVAGGGGGAYSDGGGGGAGGLVTGTITLTVGTVYTAVVGGGGAGAGAPGTASGTNGTSSTFPGVTTAVGGGGGGGGAPGAVAGSSGGSGGGGGNAGLVGSAGGAGTPGQGNAGGSATAVAPAYAAGGGGGASAVGGNATSTLAGNGGNGTASSITGTPVTYAGGGGGGVNTPSGGGTAGTGGGGAGGNLSTSAANGTANTGGGGGGGATTGVGSGGSGVVILSVPTTNYSGTTTGSPTITTSGSNTIIKYTSGSGTYTA